MCRLSAGVSRFITISFLSNKAVIIFILRGAGCRPKVKIPGHLYTTTYFQGYKFLPSQPVAQYGSFLFFVPPLSLAAPIVMKSMVFFTLSFCRLSQIRVEISKQLCYTIFPAYKNFRPWIYGKLIIAEKLTRKGGKSEKMAMSYSFSCTGGSADGPGGG
jgi:hypothetical protein